MIAVRATKSKLEEMEESFPIGSRIEVVLREDAVFCSYPGASNLLPTYIGGASHRPGKKITGYVERYDVGADLDTVRIAQSWDDNIGKSGELGTALVYEDSILSYGK